jgi:hypothetical protein
MRQRLLCLFVRRSPLPSNDAQAMAEWEHGFGFPVDTSVHIEAVRGAKRERPTAPDAAGAD